MAILKCLFFSALLSIITIALGKAIGCILLGIRESIMESRRKYIKRCAKQDNSNWRDKLSEDELQIIDDAVELIKSVDSSIEISEFVVHKISTRVCDTGFFYNDEEVNSLNIYIPFDKFMKYSKDYCFQALVHEILHSQNLRTKKLFKIDFLEGLNHWFTVWLIRNYSKTYIVPDKVLLYSIRLSRNKYLECHGHCSIYSEEVAMVQDVFDKTQIDSKEAFLNYLMNNSEYFSTFVPEEYFD